MQIGGNSASMASLVSPGHVVIVYRAVEGRSAYWWRDGGCVIAGSRVGG